MINLRHILIAGIMSLMAVSSANATMMMTVTDGTTSQTWTDTDGDGLLSTTYSFGNWSISSNTGVTNPMIGSEYIDALELSSFSVSGGRGDLTIMLTNTDMSGSNYLLDLGGTTDGTASFAAYTDAGNLEFATTDQIFSDSYSVADSGYSARHSGNSSGTFSTTLVANVSHTGSAQYTGFSFGIQVPEPAPMALLGLGLLVFGMVGRIKNRR